MKKFSHILPALLVSALLVVTAIGCSTQKNTAKSRWWHSFNARYNTYYNGSLAYIDGSLEKENNNVDNFTEIIPLYTVGNKQSRELGKGNFERAIEKCQKAIKLHSIKRRPEWTKKRRKTERDIEWLQRREYNPFLWKAWLLMGRSQFHKGAFDEAASTFSYMSRLYQTQPAIYGRARAWLAKSYIEEGWMYDAEDVIRNMRRDSIHWRAQKEWDYTYADYYIHLGDYAQAIPYLRRVIKHEMRRKQKAREWYLMGQLEAALGHKELASKAYHRVIAQNPPYLLEFNARIALTEVMSAGQAKKMISKLRRMAASDKNKEYLDQVYYAIGNIYLNERDTVSAISAYERGNSKATRSGIERGVLLLKLGDLYWQRESYSDAKRCYGAAIGMLDKERPDYEQLSNRSKVLDELVPYTDAVHLQDSLQVLAKADEKTRNEAIDRVIEALKKKEKEEKRSQADQEAQGRQSANTGNEGAGSNQKNSSSNASSTSQTQNGLWYFYNQMAINQGKTEFEKRWGKRENVDNWQRANKTVVAMTNPESENSEQPTDSNAPDEAATDSPEEQKADNEQNDPHRREYYLKQIPFTQEQVDASNKTIEDGLYHSGVIFKDKLDNLKLSEKSLRRITDEYPDFEQMPDVYYHLFLLYSRQGDAATAQHYVDLLKSNYPDNQWTTLLTDPYFKENATLGVHIEDSIYANTYDAFKEGRYRVVKTNAEMSEKRFPMGANRDKFMFISALGLLNEGNPDACVEGLKKMLEQYPQSQLAEMAGMIVRGVEEGRKLRGGTFDIGDVWQRRSVVLNETDSANARQLSPERNTNFAFVMAYHPDSINENSLLFQLAKYNFTSYMVRNFDIAIEDDGGLHRMQVSGFRNYDEALQYARQLYRQVAVMRLLGSGRAIIISEENLELLGRQYSYDDYDKFYAKNFAPLKTSMLKLLDDPEEITTVRPEPDSTPDDGFRRTDDGTVIPENEVRNPENNGTVIPDEEETKADNEDVKAENGSTVVNDIEQRHPETNATVIPDIEDSKAEERTTVIPEGNVVLPDAENSKTESGTVIPDIEETPVQKVETVMPNVEPVAPKSEVVAPKVEPLAPKTTPTKSETTPKTSPQTTAKPAQIVQPAAKKEEKPAVKPAETKSTSTGTKAPSAETKKESTETKKNTPTETKKNTSPEDEFYFDDGDASRSNKKGKNNKDKKQDDDKSELEDEYYDLDGF